MEPGLRMSIGKGPGGVARVHDAFAEFADAHGLPAAVRRSVNVALDELLANTISYGLAGREAGDVTVDVGLRPERLTITLTDDGAPFDPFGRAAPDTGLSVEDGPVGGLGIHLVRQLMDEVSYQRRADRNVIVLVKRLAGGATADHRGGRLMNITTRTQGDVTLVQVAGNLDSNTSPQAQQALDASLAAGARKVAIDCTALDYISSAGLRVLLGTAKKLSAAGGALRMFGLNDTVREVFDISGFSKILAVHPDEGGALTGF
jgi:serine/threonine-protein kinase RsbW